jgi:hypothetical protein
MHRPVAKQTRFDTRTIFLHRRSGLSHDSVKLLDTNADLATPLFEVVELPRRCGSLNCSFFTFHLRSLFTFCL